jgi:hypothetical protein
VRRAKSILFVRPDYHCTFAYRDALRHAGWKADIYVNPGYPDSLLYSNEGVRRPIQLPYSGSRVVRWVNHLLVLLWWLANFWRYRVHLYYGRPPAFVSLENALRLDRLFGDDFLMECAIGRALGVRFIFLPSGCRDDDLKATWQSFDGGKICGNCGFFDRCEDRANELHFRRIRRHFDLVIGYGTKESHEFPEAQLRWKAIDLERWRPGLEVPAAHRLPPTRNLRILHAHLLGRSGRLYAGKNIKGSAFVLAAFQRLRDEGYPVDWMEVDGVASRDMRFYQVQADIVVDQLLYGWWGSMGVEAMALGKPVVCYVRPAWRQFFLRQFGECQGLPVVEADPETIYEALRLLVVDGAFRLERGHASRRFAEAHYEPSRNARELVEAITRIDKSGSRRQLARTRAPDERLRP